MIRDNEVKWTKYLLMSLLSFSSFMLEYFSIFVIEVPLMNADISNYTPYQKSMHCVIMACLWLIVIAAILLYTHKYYDFPTKTNKADKISLKEWIVTLVCLIFCKIITFIDWHTLKVIGEFQEKNLFEFSTQYLYYVFEVGLVLLIIIYGQKAIEALLKRESSIPFGGIILAVTWGAFHFVSRGAGFEIWNGISAMIFSVLSGLMYLNLKRKYLYSYLFIAIGYLL